MAQLSGRDAATFFTDAAGKRIDASQLEVRAASCDVTVGYVMSDGKTHNAPFPNIEPQQTVVLVSREFVSIPPGHVGYALPKTGLSNDGLLCLSTGIIDPGWPGRISTVAINFDKNPIPIAENQPFLRIVVHKLTDEKAADALEYKDKAYLKENAGASKRLPQTFLNLPAHMKEFSDELLKGQARSIIFFFTVLTAVLTLWTTFVTPRILPSDVRIIIEGLNDDMDYLRTQVDALGERVRSVETGTVSNAGEAVQPAGPPPAAAVN